VTKADEETRVLPQKEGRMRSHVVCGTCWPGKVPMGTPALCGVKLLGVTPPKDAPKCDECKELMHQHALKHMMGQI
jgi:hypothetical protein